MDKALVFDIQGWIIRILGCLLALITLLGAAREPMRLQLVRALREWGYLAAGGPGCGSGWMRSRPQGRASPDCLSVLVYYS